MQIYQSSMLWIASVNVNVICAWSKIEGFLYIYITVVPRVGNENIEIQNRMSMTLVPTNDINNTNFRTPWFFFWWILLLVVYIYIYGPWSISASSRMLTMNNNITEKWVECRFLCQHVYLYTNFLEAPASFFSVWHSTHFSVIYI